MAVDTTGSGAQRPGNRNTGFPNTVSAVRLGLALLYPAAEPDINDGSFRAMDVVAEPGSIFHAEDPAPCMRPHPVMMLLDLIIKALSPALPQDRSEEHTSELQSLMRNSYAVFCLKKKNKQDQR